MALFGLRGARAVHGRGAAPGTSHAAEGVRGVAQASTSARRQLRVPGMEGLFRRRQRRNNASGLGATCDRVLSLRSWEPVPPDSEEVRASRGGDGVPVFVMLPLDTVCMQDARPVLKTPKALQDRLARLKQAGVAGVMADVWWGMVESHSPGCYDLGAYLELLRMAAAAGLKVQCVMSFHAAGGNVGDTVNIPLPSWVLEVGQENPDIFFTDARGARNAECLSLGCDLEPVLRGATPVETYCSFVRAFLTQARDYLGWTVTEVTLGLGPAGELRYPSYFEGDGRWGFPGIGEFQCYDKYMMASLRREAARHGCPEWGLCGPHDAGHYNAVPSDTGFFHPERGSYRSPYGKFFLSWYSGLLVRHADLMLARTGALLEECCPPAPQSCKKQEAVRCVRADGSVTFEFLGPVKLGVKVAGVHWWYTQSHAAELTAGYYNTDGRCGYDAIMAVLGRHGAVANFTAVEMRDCEHPSHARCSPQRLFSQLQSAAARHNVPLAGENALQRYDAFALERIEQASYGRAGAEGVEGARAEPRLQQLTFLRMGESMFENWDAFQHFIGRMSRRGGSSGGGDEGGGGGEAGGVQVSLEST